MQVLVLGTSPSAAAARRIAGETGVEIVEQLTEQVSHVAADWTVGADEPGLMEARARGVPILSCEDLARLLGEVTTAFGRERASVTNRTSANARGMPKPLGGPVAPQVGWQPSQPGSVAVQASPSGWSVPWALVPLLSLGFLTPVTIGHAAWRLRSKITGASAVLYTLAVIVMLILGGEYPDGRMPGVADAFMGVCIAASCLGGTVHAFVLRRRIFTPHPYAAANLAAESDVRFRRELRSQARETASKDPVLAQELRIGRPDLPRTYDDGGLVNVNFVPAHVLLGLPGVTPEVAAQIVARREKVGPFISAEDVAVSTDLAPHMVPYFAEYTVYFS